VIGDFLRKQGGEIRPGGNSTRQALSTTFGQGRGEG